MVVIQKKINAVEVLSKLGWNESDDLEFKSARGGVPKSLWATYCAMANTFGGIIFLGVEDDGTVFGLSNPSHIKKCIWDTLNNKTKISINLLNENDVQEIEHPNGPIIAIHVPRASRYERPVFIDQNPLTGTFRRNYEGDYHCTEQEVSRMLTDRSDESFDSRILEHYNLDDIDSKSLYQYRQRMRSDKLNHPWLDEDDIGFLTKLGGWKKCKVTGQEGLTVAGLLMFGREESLRYGVPQYSVDYREKYSDDPDIRWTDRLMIDGTWPGNLFQFYIRVVQKLSADLKVPFQLDAQLFRKGETVVHEAVREALVNALIHADYKGQGGVVIEKYKDRFEFSNPGLLLVTMEQLLHGNVSECRNKVLQTMFTMIGAAEKAGSGVDKIWRGWKSQHWRSPIIRETVQPDRVKWILSMVSLIPEESLERLHHRFGNKFQKFLPLEVQALVTADLEGEVHNARMRQMTNEHPTDITRILQKLVGKGCLRQDGRRRWSRYSLPTISSPTHLDDHRVHKDDHRVHKDDHRVHKDDHRVHIPIPENEWDELIQIAAIVANSERSNSNEVVVNTILKLCENHWLTKSQLSQLLKRNPKGLKTRFLKMMVEQGQLRLRYPDKPQRTDQAYAKNQTHDVLVNK